MTLAMPSKHQKPNGTTANIDHNETEIDTSRPTALYTPTGPRTHTLSIALPASLIHNSKSKVLLRTQLAGSIARALAVFSVDEIVIFDDGDIDPSSGASSHPPNRNSTKCTAMTHPAHFLRHILTYLETPPFMRTRLFPMHENLERAGTLPSLDIPSHLRGDEWCEFREGVTVGVDGEGTWVDCGFGEGRERVVKGVEIPDGMRVTLGLGSEKEDDGKSAVAVSPAAPREEMGCYWGYQVREAGSLSAVFTECGFDGGYDLSVGTSERGEEVTKTVNNILQDEARKEWQHLIIVFGGVKGLEDAAKNDQELVRTGIGKGNVKELFDYWVNLLPGQGSRTIRTEEALWMGLMGTRRLIDER